MTISLIEVARPYEPGRDEHLTIIDHLREGSGSAPMARIDYLRLNYSQGANSLPRRELGFSRDHRRKGIHRPCPLRTLAERRRIGAAS
jgi:hypothetical protein